MKKIIRLLLDYWFFALIVIALTFVNVNFELELPDYMSDIVSNGIQYGGIGATTPEIVTEESVQQYFLLMSDEQKASFTGNYIPVEKGETIKILNQEITLDQNAYYLSGSEDIDLSEIITKVGVINEESFKETLPLNGQSLSEFLKDEENQKIVLSQLDKFFESFTEENIQLASRNYIKAEYQKIGLDTASIQTDYIMRKGASMIAFSLGSVICAIISSYFVARIYSGIAFNLRSKVFRKVESFSMEEMNRFSSASLITRTTNDVVQVSVSCAMLLSMVLRSPMMGISSLFKVMRYPGMLWILAVAIGTMIFLLVGTLIIASPKFTIIQKLTDKLNLVTREMLGGMMVIRAFNQEDEQQDRFEKANRQVYETGLFIDRIMTMIGPVMSLVMNGLTIAIIWFGAIEVNIGTMNVGEIMAFIQYAMHVVMSFMMIGFIWMQVPRALVSVNRIYEVLDTEPTITDPKEPETLPEENGVLEFNNVSFAFPDAQESVLEDISFKVNPGETVAFIGSTGSGKSTLVNLIVRFYDVTKGAITYCGKDIRNISLKQLRERIGYISQKAVLFDGTIRSNIAFGKDVSEEDINEAIDISQSTKIVEEKEEGLDSVITQGGTNVSGGQKQRLSIARALAKKPDIYIFDDSFSALDYKTDKDLRQALNNLIEKTKATVLIVAQRISSIRNADRIIVLDEGKIRGIGSHEQLMKTCELYQEIARSQLSEEEL
jgi:ATP-binding cassette subfamily B multidrug efflux pump